MRRLKSGLSSNLREVSEKLQKTMSETSDYTDYLRDYCVVYPVRNLMFRFLTISNGV